MRFPPRVVGAAVVAVGLLGVATSKNAPGEIIEDLTRAGYGVARIGRIVVAVSKVAYRYSRLPADATLAEKHEAHQYGASVALDVIKRNGGVYIKFGQHISALQLVIPEEYCTIMRVLSDAAPQVTFDEARKVVCEDLGLKSLGERFRYFEEAPIASASLAQVSSLCLPLC